MSKGMTVLVIGSGAREHAISSAYEKSGDVQKIVVAPGNDFIAFARGKEVLVDKNCSLKDPLSLLEIAKKYKPDLVDVAQDDALAAGTVNLLQKHGFRVFGPTQEAARIEWDKRWSRKFMQRHHIPTPGFKYFDAEEPAKVHLKSLYAADPNKVMYVKATGLCAGKGALKAADLNLALARVDQMKTFGKAGEVFLIEDGLVGEEFSCYALSDGQTYHIFKSAQDNKTVFNFDEGDQTGGMGAISPAQVTRSIAPEIEDQLIARVITGMRSEGVPYTGILYLGGVVVGGKPFNIEYNARWGDPECQVVLPSVKTNYVDVVQACLEGDLKNIKIREDDNVRVCVVGASRGYPSDYSNAKGKRIYGLREAMSVPGVSVFGAGIAMKQGKCYASGGRLFSIVAEGKTIEAARQRAYAAIAHISIEGNNLHYRTDIGWRDMERFLN